MSQGCPVLISNKSALLEVNGDTVEYFDPDNKYEIKNVMNKILYDGELRKNNIKKANNHFKKFNWDKTVSETVKIIAN